MTLEKFREFFRDKGLVHKYLCWVVSEDIDEMLRGSRKRFSKDLFRNPAKLAALGELLVSMEYNKLVKVWRDLESEHS